MPELFELRSYVQRGPFIVRYCIYQTRIFASSSRAIIFASILGRDMEGVESELALGFYLSSMDGKLAADLDEIELYARWRGVCPCWFSR